MLDLKVQNERFMSYLLDTELQEKRIFSITVETIIKF